MTAPTGTFFIFHSGLDAKAYLEEARNQTAEKLRAATGERDLIVLTQFLQRLECKLDELKAQPAKPWHSAQPGDIWVVDGQPRAVVKRAHGEPHTFVDPFSRIPGFPVTAPKILRARCIFPEKAS